MKKRECVRASLLFAPSVVARLVASIIPTYAIVPWRCPGDGGGHFGIGLVHYAGPMLKEVRWLRVDKRGGFDAASGDSGSDQNGGLGQ